MSTHAWITSRFLVSTAISENLRKISTSNWRKNSSFISNFPPWTALIMVVLMLFCKNDFWGQWGQIWKRSLYHQSFGHEPHVPWLKTGMNAMGTPLFIGILAIDIMNPSGCWPSPNSLQIYNKRTAVDSDHLPQHLRMTSAMTRRNWAPPLTCQVDLWFVLPSRYTISECF